MEYHAEEAAEPLIAYVYGDDVAPDFAALAACGFSIVCLDKGAPWFRDEMVAEARDNGLTAIAFEMKYVLRKTVYGRLPARSQA